MHGGQVEGRFLLRRQPGLRIRAALHVSARLIQENHSTAYAEPRALAV